TDELLPSRPILTSPDDGAARYAQTRRKRRTTWVGYTVHLTATGEPSAPHLITPVATTPASVSDDRMTEPIHQARQSKALLPQAPLVDTGYVAAERLLTRRAQVQLDVVGPTRPDDKGPARAQAGCAASPFQIDRQRQGATCPEGKTSRRWT